MTWLLFRYLGAYSYVEMGLHLKETLWYNCYDDVSKWGRKSHGKMSPPSPFGMCLLVAPTSESLLKAESVFIVPQSLRISLRRVPHSRSFILSQHLETEDNNVKCNKFINTLKCGVKAGKWEEGRPWQEQIWPKEEGEDGDGGQTRTVNIIEKKKKEQDLHLLFHTFQVWR